MSVDPEQDPSTVAPGVRTPRAHRAHRGWRFGTPVVLLLSGALFVVSGVNSGGTDLRPGRYTDLASLVQTDADRYAGLQSQAAELGKEVDQLRRAVGGADAQRIQDRADELRDPAGLEPRTGPGVTVVLSDAPRDVLETALADGRKLEPYVVHQQDIQAVVNALWAGGASAITIQGQRVVTTTGIKCEGNAVQLQGQPYPQPYTIEAIGDQTALTGSLEADAYVSAFRADAARPDVAIGWDFELTDDVEAQGYEGLLDITSARPLPAR